MRKLTVKNFSVIKEAELEFGKITVLIGPQASGKSLLCKLACFLSKHAIEFALNAILSKTSFDDYRSALVAEFVSRFPIDTWQADGSAVEFSSSDFWVRVFGTSDGTGSAVKIEFAKQFEELFESLSKRVEEAPAFGADSRETLAEQVTAQLNLLLTVDSVDHIVYIPVGRAFFVNQSLGYRALNNPDIDPFIRDFSLEIRLGESRSPHPNIAKDAREVLLDVGREMIRIAGGHVVGHNASAVFKRTCDGRALPFARLSSGTQEMLPMFNVLGQMSIGQRYRIIFPRPMVLPGTPNKPIFSKGLVYLEEPETNVFPETQYELVQLFAHLSSAPSLDFSWVITTHSPYILSSFNNLIYAGQLGKDKTIRRKIPIDRKYWIEPGTFAAYSVHDGKTESILSESGLINGEYLDGVSEKIGNEFDSLLRLEYDKTKAS